MDNDLFHLYTIHEPAYCRGCEGWGVRVNEIKRKWNDNDLY